ASRFVFAGGGDPSTPEGLKRLGIELGVSEPEAAAAAATAKDSLRANTAEAVARGVWGVPTFDMGGELFWGADSFPMMLNYLQQPDLFDTPEMKRLETLPIGAARS
ncbi:MAG: DsbA family protein, partial [Steroidobacteraceae bacterium]